jgi:regulator of protease activity HflC (stomatin/prohibitin superfamily)
MNKQRGSSDLVMFVVLALFVCLVAFGFFFGFIPAWKVWSAQKDGEATLARSESARQVLVQQAKAERDAASLRAEAIAIVGKAAKEYPEYRTQEFIGAFAEALKEGKVHSTIYVPTEANIPILEAGKR